MHRFSDDTENIEAKPLFKLQENEVEQISETNSKKLNSLLYFVILGAFISQFFIIGMINNFGTLKAHIIKDMPRNTTYIDQMGSVNYCILYMVGVFFSSVVNLVGCKYVHVIGCMMSALALLMSSFSSNIFILFPLYGILYGFGAGFIFFSTLYVQTQYFGDYLALVSGLISGGSSIGTLLQSLVLNSVCLKVGWQNTLRIYSLIMALLSLVAIFYCIPDYLNQNKPYKTNKIQFKRGGPSNPLKAYTTIFQNWRFIILCISCFMYVMSFLIPLFYMKSYAEYRGVSSAKAASLVGCYSIFSLVGRLLVGYIGNIFKNNQLYILTAGYFLIGVCNILTFYCLTFNAFVLYASLLGFFEATYHILPIPIIKTFFSLDTTPTEISKEEEKDNINKAVAVFYVVKAVAIFTGPLTLSIIYEKYSKLSTIFTLAGATCILSSLTLGFIKMIEMFKYKK